MFKCDLNKATPTEWVDALLLQEAMGDLGVTKSFKYLLWWKRDCHWFTEYLKSRKHIITN